MAEDDDKGHYGKKALDKLHERIKGLDNGACLTGHEANFKDFGKKFTCNYRYQAYEHANANADISDRLHSYSTRLKNPIETSAPVGGKSGRYPAHYCAELKPPKAGYWHIGGPPKTVRRGSFGAGPVKIPATKNFTQDTWPYWNNAHHLIPKGTLKARILQETVKVSNLIQQCLLEAKYNINFKINMLLLPQDREVADILDIPRHLQLEHRDGKVKIEVANHPVYNKMVLEIDDGLNKIIKSYARTCKNALKKGHKKPKAGLDKKKLEDLSEVLLDLILNWTGPVSLDAKARQAGF